MTGLISFLALIIGIAALIVSLLCYSSVFSLKKYLRDHETERGFDSSEDGRNYSIRDEIVEVVKTSNRLSVERTKSQNVKVVKEPVNYELPTEAFNMIVETVTTAVEDNLKKSQATQASKAPDKDNSVEAGASSSIPESQPEQNPEVQEKKKPSEFLYASAYDAEKRTFYKVEKDPFDGTIYEIGIDPEDSSRGIIDVYQGASEQVVQCRDFLDHCCETSGSGMNITTVETGSVINNNGHWQIENKLKVKFE